MGGLLSTIGIFAVLFLAIGVLWLVAWQFGLLKNQGAMRSGGGKLAEDDEWESAALPTPYATRDRLLSPGETEFHAALRGALPILTSAAGKAQEPLISCKVRLLDLFRVDPDKLNGTPYKSAENRIIKRHADFVLCNPETTRPFLLIELDDKSHERADRKGADAFLNRACAAAGLPILRVKAAAGYSSQTLAKAIGEKLGVTGR